MAQFNETNTQLAEQFVEPIVDVSLMLAMKARDKVAKGLIEPRDTSDAIKAVETWAKFRPTQETEGVPLQEYEADIAALIERARRHMPKENYKAFLDDLKAVGREPRPDGDGGQAE